MSHGRNPMSHGRNPMSHGVEGPADRPFHIGVLDQSPIPEGATVGDALRNSIDLARLTDGLGFDRYWVAEHHGGPGLACASPEVLIGPIAAATSRLRVGSGGVMLPHYSPLKVAESFAMLSGLYPGRIDLGLGRAPGTDAATALTLQRDRRRPSPDDFPEQLDELLGYFGGSRPAAGRLSTRFSFPGPPLGPEPWMLGSSPQSAIWAAERGLPYCFADFINPNGAAIAAAYRERYQPSEAWPVPHTAVAAWAVCAETEDEAEDLTASFRMMMALLYRGQLIAVPPVEKALRFLANEPGRLLPDRRVITGIPSTVRRGIESLAEEYGAQEVLIVNILYDHAARRRSYKSIAEAFELPSADVTAD